MRTQRFAVLRKIGRRAHSRTMRTCQWLALAAALAAALLISQVAVADHWHGGVHVYGGHPGSCIHSRPRCVTDWYGGSGWSGGVSVSPFGIGYGISYSSGFAYRPYGPFFGPAVLYEANVIAPPVVIVEPASVVIGRRPTRVLVPPVESPEMLDVLQQHAERRRNVPNDATDGQTITASTRAGQQRSRQFQAEGDRLVREKNYVKAYLKYLESEREAQDRGEVYFRQAFTLVALGRYSHAVLRLKRGVQVDPNWPSHATSLTDFFGREQAAQTTEFVQRVADWTNQDVRDPDRLFLIGAMLHCQGDPRSAEFLTAAHKWSGRDAAHVVAFLNSDKSRLASGPVVAQTNLEDRRRRLPAPPPPQDDEPTPRATPKLLKSAPVPTPEPDDQDGPRLPRLDRFVPPEPAARELILPDPVNREYVPQP